MQNQRIEKRYIDKQKLIALLRQLFGSNYFLNVGPLDAE
jgi:hypothetical protein